jgi:hypothetical protein
MKRELQDIAIIIVCNCLNNNIYIDVEWIQRSNNDQDGFISRIVDYDDWGVSDEIFLHLDSLWGLHEIDWFANNNNHKLPVFYSRYWAINAIGIDAFTVIWNGVNGWCVPPVCFVSIVLRDMKQCLTFGTIIVPLWTSASFWPILSPNGDGFIKEVNGCIDLPTNTIFFNPGKGRKGVFGSIGLPFRMLA